MSAQLFPDENGPVSAGHGNAQAAELPSTPARSPLADRVRPLALSEYVGQRHLLAQGKVLERMLASQQLTSLILWGPPGAGKTTLARLIAKQSGLRFVAYSAVLSGIKEIRELMVVAERTRASEGQGTLVFVDEIHRFNKAQQDAFLPYVERGDIVLIGATTENPSFEVNSALLSRCRVLELLPLCPAELIEVLEHALVSERGLNGQFQLETSQLERIAHHCDGDARRALGVLETLAGIVPAGDRVASDCIAEALQRKVLHYDKGGEEHYNLISALHKSIRNCDENAALYWLTRMMSAGEDGNYLARRLVRMASEDIGLAEPFALRIALDAAEAFRQLGYPEGKLALVQAAVYLARARKSNALYVALGEAEKDVERTAAEPVPKHLRNAVTTLMRQAGYGMGYRYAHDDPRAIEEMQCMPPALAGKRYFKRPVRESATGGASDSAEQTGAGSAARPPTQ